MKCPKCRFENPEGARFCTECSAPMEFHCPKCGAKTPPTGRFCMECAHPLKERREEPPPQRAKPESYTPKYLADRILQSRSALEGERKQVTVLFADVKSSMKLAEQVDPEEWHRILDRFFQILAAGIHRFEGTVNQYTGDGIMALFGAPIAHEDHARRACYAVLHLRQELRSYGEQLKRTRGLNFSVRMGLSSGEVIVGKIGDDLRMDYTAQGQVVNLAERMEQLAPSESAYLTEHTAALVSGFFQLRDLQEFQIKGVNEPVRVYELQDVGKMRTRLEVSRARGFSKFVGRSDEMATLELALQRATEGNGQVVGVVGEAGLGKSRLCLEFAEHCRARDIRVLQARCPAHGKTVALLPILELLRNAFDITAQDAEQTARERIAGQLLLLNLASDELLPLVFDFLGVPDPERPAPQLDPEARRRQLYNFVRRLIQARSERESLVLLFDDIQWIDPGSDAFLTQLVEATSGTRTMLLVNFRPEYEAEWIGKPYYLQLPLSPLGPGAVDELLSELLGDTPALADLRNLIRERTGGNPFFIEEVVQSLAESGSLEGTPGRYHLAETPEALEIPPSVQVVLMARIDRLGEMEKGVLQAASVIGKQFSELLLKQVAELPEGDIAEAISVLRDAEFIREESLYPEVEYAFKHPLTHEVAYTSQLSEPLRRVHGRVARALEELRADKLDECAGLLSHHWEAAGEPLDAARWRARAANVVSRTDLEQAYLNWENVLVLLRKVEPSEEATDLAIEARIRSMSLGHLIGVSSSALRSAFAAGTELVERVGDASDAPYLEAAFVDHLVTTNQLAEASERLPRLLRVTTQSEDLELKLGTAHVVLQALFWTGKHRDARRVMDALEPLAADDLDLGSRFSVLKPLCSFHAWRVMLLAYEGRLREARAAREVALELARRHEPYAVIWILCLEAEIAQYTGERARLEEVAEARELAEKIGGSYWQTIADFYLGLARKVAGDLHSACSLLECALTSLRARPHPLQAGVMGHLAEVYVQLGDPERAHALAEEAVEFAQGRGSPQAEQSALLSLSRVLLRSEGAVVRDAAATAIERGLTPADDTSLVVLIPQFLVERAQLSRLRGEETARERDLREAHRLFTEMGATGHAQRLATELEI